MGLEGVPIPHRATLALIKKAKQSMKHASPSNKLSHIMHTLVKHSGAIRATLVLTNMGMHKIFQSPTLGLQIVGSPKASAS